MSLGSENLRKRVVSYLMPALRALPPRWATRTIAALGAWELYVNFPRRLLFGRAVRRGAKRIGCDWAVGQVARQLAGNTVRWHARDFLLEGLSPHQVDSMIRVSGREHLESALSQGKGVVLLFNHFGPFLIPAHWLIRQGFPLRWFTERPRHISRMVSETFGSDGPLGQRGLFLSRSLTPGQGGSAIRRAVRMLGSGMIVQVAGDVRWAGTRCTAATFLGQRFEFTTNWVTLAARSSAPVLPVFALMNSDGTYRVDFHEPWNVEPDFPSAEEATALVQRNLDKLENYIRSHPNNSGEYLFWLDRHFATRRGVPRLRTAIH